MGFYDSLALTAQNLIRSKGAAVVLKRAGTPVYTASEGTAETPYAEFGTFAVTIDGMLKEVDAVPVDEGWEYDPEKGGPDDGGVPHDGPMAADVQRVMGDDVAPGGRMIDLVSMNGKTMGAVQELSKRVKRIEARMAA